MNEQLSAALVAAQKAMPPVEKDGVNPHFKSRFVTLDALIAQTRPVLNEHGLAILALPSVGELGQPVLDVRIVHTSGEQLEFSMPLLLDGRTDMQALGSAITYGRRFAWASALGISSETDDDGESTRPDPKPEGKGKPDPKPGRTFITEAQRKRLFAIAAENNMSSDQLKALLLEMHGDESTALITRDKYDETVAAIQTVETPF